MFDFGDTDLEFVLDVEHLEEAGQHLFAEGHPLDAEVSQEWLWSNPVEIDFLADTLLAEPLFDIEQELIGGAHTAGQLRGPDDNRTRVALECLERFAGLHGIIGGADVVGVLTHARRNIVVDLGACCDNEMIECHVAFASMEHLGLWVDVDCLGLDKRDASLLENWLYWNHDVFDVAPAERHPDERWNKGEIRGLADHGDLVFTFATTLELEGCSKTGEAPTNNNCAYHDIPPLLSFAHILRRTC